MVDSLRGIPEKIGRFYWLLSDNQGQKYTNEHIKVYIRNTHIHTHTQVIKLSENFEIFIG